ncbi:DNA-protecting protein DprA [Candidatus Saccharibacteria bacterium]|nr:DNA-protecting protein DprA [Candidatus Saccharibacteria bacterium]
MQKSLKINEIVPDEADFTSLLSSIPLSPKMLYYCGILPKKRVKSVAIVGSRKPTKYGLDIAFSWARELAERGVVVISGLALGIDAAAHRGALAGREGNLHSGAPRAGQSLFENPSGVTTIAVLGTRIDQVYPASNQELGEEIMKCGAVISEYPVGAVGYPGNFLNRNRIVSGLADAVLVVEANERSGSLATAEHARRQGRPVFAVPADITRPLSAGCNALLKQGAMVATSVDDILAVVAPELLPPKKKARKKGRQATLAEMLRAGQPTEQILEALGIDVVTLNMRKTELELRGEL